jgi:hypothetical protein
MGHAHVTALERALHGKHTKVFAAGACTRRAAVRAAAG